MSVMRPLQDLALRQGLFPFLSHYFSEIVVSKKWLHPPMAALMIVGTEQVSHISLEVVMPQMLCAQTVISRQVELGTESWAHLMVSRRKEFSDFSEDKSSTKSRNNFKTMSSVVISS